MKKVIIFGTFDVIHPGHIHMFKEAKAYGDYLVVVISRDPIACQVKGKMPTYNESVRLENVKKLGIADKVRLGCLGENRYQAIDEEKPDIVALGYDQKAFVDDLTEAVDDYVQIVRLQPYLPNIYKSSKLKEII